MQVRARARERATDRRWWGALLLLTVGLVMAALAVRGAAGTAAAPGPLLGLNETGQVPSAASGTWLRVTTNLSGAPELVSAFPDVAVSSSGWYVAVVWQEQAAGDSEFEGYIYIRCIKEGSSQTWGAKSAVPGSYQYVPGQGQRRGQMPAVALYGNRVHVVWSGGYGGVYDKIYYQGGTIGADNLVTWDSYSPQTVADVSGATLAPPDIGVDGNGYPHVVWQQENADETRHIYYNVRGDSAWGTPQKVSRDADVRNRDPAIAVEGTTAHVTWVGSEQSQTGPVSVKDGVIYYANSGAGWAAPVAVESAAGEEQLQHPSIAARGGTVGIAWETWRDHLEDGVQDQVDQEDYWSVYYNTNSAGWSFLTREFLWDRFYPHFGDPYGGDEYVNSVRPSLAYFGDSTPYIALARTYPGLLSDPMITYSWVKGTGWSGTVMPLGGSTSGERGAARAVIGRYGAEDHVHFVYQVVVGVELGQNRWDVFYTSDEVYNTVHLPAVMRNY